MKLIIDGTEIPNEEIEGLDTLTWSQTEDDTEVITKKISGELTLTGSAYDYIKAQLIDDAAGLTKILLVEIIEDCCGKIIPAQLTVEGLDWCDGDCSVKVTLTERTDILTCFKSTWIAHNYPTASFPLGFQNYPNHPKVPYCVELRPNWLQDLVIIFGIMFNLYELIMIPVVAIISGYAIVICALLSVLHSLGIANSIDCPDELADGVLDDFLDMKRQMNVFIIGCGRKHPSPFVRSYIQNACDRCGITFISSILNNPAGQYYNIMYLYAPAKKGYMDGVEPTKSFIPDNAPYQTLELFMQDMNKVFNGRYKLRGANLYFERKDAIIGTVIYNIVTTDKDRLETFTCYKWNGKTRPAYATREYEKDAIDYVGNEARDRGNDVIDFNNPVKKWLSGEDKVTLPFGLSRYRDDGIERDVLTAYKNAPFFSTPISQHNYELIMAQSSTYLPKLLLWDGNDLNNAKVKIFSLDAGYSGRHPDEYTTPKVFNYPFWFDAVTESLGYPNLWSFHKIDDPNNSTVKNFEFTFSMQYNCNDLNLLDDLIGSAVVTPQGTGIINSWQINFSNNLIEIKGTL